MKNMTKLPFILVKFKRTSSNLCKQQNISTKEFKKLSKFNLGEVPLTKSISPSLLNLIQLEQSSMPMRMQMNINKNRRMEKFWISFIEQIIAERSNQSFFHCFIILKILISLRTRKAEMAPPPETLEVLSQSSRVKETAISAILRRIIMASKMLQQSFRYCLKPSAISLITISMAKIPKKIRLKMSNMRDC